MKLKKYPFMLILYGPTGVGKTDLSFAIADKIPSEIINMDVGQFYTPLSIGTAKPDWKQSHIPHHLFDSINEPIHYSVAEYRTVLYKLVSDIIQRKKLPILVGGSGFYLHALLYPPQAAIDTISVSQIYPEGTDLWQVLYSIDPQRALAIKKNDIYRIERALSIWHITKKLPSSFNSSYQPETDFMILFIEREREELKRRINERVVEMINQGWLEEAQRLIGTEWQTFLEKKNLIGYPEIFTYLSGDKSQASFNTMIERIQAQTRQYAKRQFTFWRKLEREIQQQKEYTGNCIGCLEKVNLSDKNGVLYSNDLIERLLYRCKDE